MSGEKLRFKEIPASFDGVLKPRCAYHDVEPLTDAWWARDGVLYSVRRRSGEADLLETCGPKPRAGISHRAIVGLGGHVPQGVVVNVRHELLYYDEGTAKSLWKSSDEIAFFDVNRALEIVAVVGTPSQWRAAVITRRQVDKETPRLARVIGAVWLDEERALFQMVERKGAEETIVFVMRNGAGEYVRLFETTRMLRADLASNGNGRVFFSGGTSDSADRGGWLFDPMREGPCDTFASILPVGQVCFVDPDTVVYPAQHSGRNVVVVANSSGTRTFALSDRLPTRVTTSPDGSEIAWAEPSQEGGKLWVAELPRR